MPWNINLIANCRFETQYRFNSDILISVSLWQKSWQNKCVSFQNKKISSWSSLDSTILAVSSNCFEHIIESTEHVDKLKNSTFEIIVGDLTKIFKENSTIE